MEDAKATSVRQRLLNLARESGDDYNQVLVRYAGLRFLARLASSPHADKFLLKGATMFLVWHGSMHRPTKDIDLLGFTAPDETVLRSIMQEVCRQETESDGLIFDADSVQVEPIREEAAYGGLRCTLDSRLGTAKLRLQLDVGFGDAVTPEPCIITIPRLLEDGEPQTMRAYTPETVIAEKLEAIVNLGLANSRMKDYFDLDILLPNASPVILGEAIKRTFARRGTIIPPETPLGLAATFWEDATAKRRWAAFLTKNRLPLRSLQEVCERIAARLQPALARTTITTTHTTTGAFTRGNDGENSTSMSDI